jgi:aminopeptidase-like protein
VLSCLGDAGAFHYKQSRHKTSRVDRAVQYVLNHADGPSSILPFTPLGYDERQYGSPGINLPVGCLMRTPNGFYPEYHTSADDLSLISSKALAESIALLTQIVAVLEQDRTYVNTSPKGEPQLGQRGLYSQLGGESRTKSIQDALLWVLNMSDGKHSLLDIATQSTMELSHLDRAANALSRCGLLAVAPKAAS